MLVWVTGNPRLIEMWDDLVLPRAVSEPWIHWLAEHRGVHLRDWRDRARAGRGDRTVR